METTDGNGNKNAPQMRKEDEAMHILDPMTVLALPAIELFSEPYESMLHQPPLLAAVQTPMSRKVTARVKDEKFPLVPNVLYESQALFEGLKRAPLYQSNQNIDYSHLVPSSRVVASTGYDHLHEHGMSIFYSL